MAIYATLPCVYPFFVYHSEGREKITDNGCSIVCSQHKCGTFNMLQAVDSYFKSAPDNIADEVKVTQCFPGDLLFFLNLEKMDMAIDFDYETAHTILMIRHPLDVVVSAYRFHLMSKESWLHETQENGLTYQEELQSMNRTHGLLYELTKGIAYQDTKRLLDFIDSPVSKNFQFLKLEQSKYSPFDFANDLSDALALRKDTIQSIIVEELAYEKFLKYKQLSPVDEEDVEEIRSVDRYGAEYPYEFSLHLECVHYEAFEEIFGLNTLRKIGYADSIAMYKADRFKKCGRKAKKKKRMPRKRKSKRSNDL